MIAGAGGNFCSGGDVHEIIGPLTKMAMPELLAFTRMTGDLVRAMRACPQPIVAAVDGVCAGAGAILAMASDIRLASHDARTAFLFTRVGLAGADMGACAILPRLIGHGRAADLLYSGRAMTADEGLAWGFFARVVDAEMLAHEADNLARTIADGPAFAHAMTKRQLDMEWNVSIDTALEMEAQAQAICMVTNDFTRAYEAFADKRRPSSRATDERHQLPRLALLRASPWRAVRSHRAVVRAASRPGPWQRRRRRMPHAGRANWAPPVSSTCASPTTAPPPTSAASRSPARRSPAIRASPISPSPCRGSDRARSASPARPQQRAEWLPKVASGEAIAAFAMTEPDTGSDAANLAMTARA